MSYAIVKLWLVVVTLIFFQGIQHVSLKNIFVSHRGQDEDNCGNWTLPCRSVRQAVNISSDNDVIYIDYAEGTPYNECEQLLSKKNHAIMLDKSLSFYGFNGKAILHCEHAYPFFEINSKNIKNCSVPRIVFSNLILTSRETFFNAISAISISIELEFHFCDIKRSSFFVVVQSLSCSIQVFNSNIRSSRSPIYMLCGNLTARLIGSTIFSCPSSLISNSNYFSNRVSLLPYETVLNVHISNSSIIPTEEKQSCGWYLSIVPRTGNGNITIKSSKFLNFNNYVKLPSRFAALSIYSRSPRFSANILLDELHFENINSGQAVHLEMENKQCHVSILNSIFVNTSTALVCKINICHANLYNITFNSTHNTQRSEGGGIVSLLGRTYHLLSCHFFQNIPVQNPSYPLIRTDSSTKITFENCSYEIHPIAESACDGNTLSSNMFYILSYDATAINTHGESMDIKGYFTMLCPQGYELNLHVEQYNFIFFKLFTAFCQQCPPKTYSLDRGEAQKIWSNHITCHDCPAGGNCVEGQVTSKPNFWGYKSNQTVTFLQCLPKYCCDIDHCKTYHSCYGNRMGTLCGRCPIGMSESLFDTKCKANKDCTSVIFWPAISAYLILYLLFFLYKKDIINFVLRHITPRYIWCFRNGQNFNSGGLLKILFYYYQVVHLLSTYVGSDVKVQFFDDMNKHLSTAFNFLIIAIPSIDCPFQDLRPVQKAVIVHSVGYSLLALLCLLYLSIFVFKMVKKLRAGSTLEIVAPTETTGHNPNLTEQNSFLGRVSGAFVYISLLMYASSAQLCLSLLHCVPVGDNHVLFLDGNVKCYQTFQYFFLAYMISSILPFCVVPVLGSYLLKSGRIGVKQFCSACIFPLPFSCFWMYLLLKDCRCCNQNTYNTIVENGNTAVRSGQGNDETQSLDGQEITFISPRNRSTTTGSVCTVSNEALSTKSESAILNVLLGPFRTHKAFMCFPSSHIPWEGFLIFRRLVLIIVLTFVYDIQLKLFLALVLCVAILIFHMFVHPFQKKSDNILESFSLGGHVVLCGLTFAKALYYGEGSSLSKRLPVLNVIEKILTVAPVFIIMMLIIFSLAVSLVFGFKFLVSVLSRTVRRRLRFIM